MTSDLPKIVAVDGPAASGKGTLARSLAQELGFAYMDTGLLYRAVGHEVLRARGNPEDEDDAMRGVARLKMHMRLDGPDLRNDAAGNAASKVAALPPVRAALLAMQRDFARNPGEPYLGALLDGRDIGTVVCPQAQLKLFITANDEIRAQRRMKELQSKGLAVTYSAVLEDMRARDARDTSRKAAPMKPADDAIVIDTSDLSATEVLSKALDYAKKAFC